MLTPLTIFSPRTCAAHILSMKAWPISTSVASSASLNCVFWKLEMRLPKASRCFT